MPSAIQPSEPPQQPPPKRLSLLAATSLLAALPALAAPLLWWFPLATAIMSLIALGTAIAAIFRIKRSQRRLTGLPLAILGMIISLPVLAISVAYPLFQPASPPAEVPDLIIEMPEGGLEVEQP